MADNDKYLNANNGNRWCPFADLSHAGDRFFEIRVKGQLDSSWSEWLEDWR
jgi:hypothetical protein